MDRKVLATSFRSTNKVTSAIFSVVVVAATVFSSSSTIGQVAGVTSRARSPTTISSTKSTAHFPADTTPSVISALTKRVEGQLWTDNQAFVWPFTMGHKKGTFKSAVHINVPIPVVRRDVEFIDDNNFVTMLVLDSLFDAQQNLLPSSSSPLNASLVLNETVLALAVEAALTSRDQNSPSTSDALFGFWPQTEVTKTLADGSKATYFEEWSLNLSQIGARKEQIDQVVAFIFDLLKLQKVAWLFEFLVNFMLQIVTSAFNLPADADDTGNMIEVGTRWLESEAIRKTYPSASSLWSSAHLDVTSAFHRVFDEASYCPFDSSRIEQNVIDTRSFAAYREFLWNVSSSNSNSSEKNAERCFVTTWIKNSTGQASFWKNESVGSIAPFNVNNLDASVSANMLLGFVTSAVRDPTSISMWFNQANNSRVRTTVSMTSKLVQWTVREGILAESGITDLLSLYYPTSLLIPSFTARLLNVLEEAHLGGILPSDSIPVLEEMRTDLFSAMSTGGTEYVMNKMKTGELCFNGTLLDLQATPSSSVSSAACWTSFLGASDLPKPSHDDRFFSTAIAVNTLLDTWTTTSPVTTSTGAVSVQWRNGTSSEVINAVKSGASFLQAFYETNPPDYGFMGAFFSGSVHNSPGSAPFNFPANEITYLRNGSHFNCSDAAVGSLSFDEFKAIRFGVRGIMSRQEFDDLVSGGMCNGMPLGSLKNQPLNDLLSPWPFWSSQALTLSFGVKALAKATAVFHQP